MCETAFLGLLAPTFIYYMEQIYIYYMAKIYYMAQIYISSDINLWIHLPDDNIDLSKSFYFSMIYIFFFRGGGGGGGVVGVLIRNK